MPLQLSKGGDLDAVQALLDRKVPDLLPLSLDPQGKINAETSGTDMSNPFNPTNYMLAFSLFSLLNRHKIFLNGVLKVQAIGMG